MKLTPHPALHFLLSTILIAGCAREPARIHRLAWPTMGTIAAVQSADLETAQKLRSTAIREFETMDEELSSWKESSTLSLINRRAGTETPTEVSASFTNILLRSTAICRLSDGAFNPLLGPVLHAWGFGNVPAPQTAPSSVDLTKALLLTDISDIRLQSLDGTRTVQLDTPGMQLDFGAIAKGYAVDLVWQAARAEGLTDALIDLGGNLRAMGQARPGRGGWLTGVKDPFNPDRLIATLMLYDGEGIAPSGNYERFVVIEGERCAHIIDGRTAMPVKGMAGVTVVSPDAATADALSTALFVLGVEDGKRLIAEHYPDSLALWIPDRQPAEIIATPPMEQRLERLSD